jgi:sugar phosphate isomerase/epimerase
MEAWGHTLGTPHLDVTAALALFAAVGLDAAEVIWQEDYRSGLTPGDARQLREVRTAAAEVGCPVRALTPYMAGLNSPDDARRRHDIDCFLRCVDDAREVGARKVRVYAGTYHPEKDRMRRDKLWGHLVESLHRIASAAASAGVTLCVENHFGTMAFSARETRRLVDEVAHPAVRVLYDQANLVFARQEEPADAIELQAGVLGHVHVKDLVFTKPDAPFTAGAVDRVTEAERTVASRIIGDGVIDWPWITRRLLDAGYDDAISFEYEARWHPNDLPPPEIGLRTSVRRFRDMLAAVMQELP